MLSNLFLMATVVNYFLMLVKLFFDVSPEYPVVSGHLNTPSSPKPHPGLGISICNSSCALEYCAWGVGSLCTYKSRVSGC